MTETPFRAVWATWRSITRNWPHGGRVRVHRRGGIVVCAVCGYEYGGPHLQPPGGARRRYGVMAETPFRACAYVWGDGWGDHTCSRPEHDGDHRCTCDMTRRQEQHEPPA